MELVPNLCNVVRAVLRKDEIDSLTGAFTPQAFMRRRDSQDRLTEEGLSVEKEGARTYSEIAASFKKCRALAQLQTGNIRNLGLDVISAPLPHNLSHAEIRGIPDDIEKEEQFARSLRDLATKVFPP